jgi:hypothetical protein
MRWFRSNLRLGSRFALIALAVQVLLAFGHIDFCDLGPASARAAAMVDGSGAVGPGKSDSGDKSRPADRCPICALIQLAATSTPSAAPALPPPTMLGAARLEVPAQLALAATSHYSFQARAPPAI